MPIFLALLAIELCTSYSFFNANNIRNREVYDFLCMEFLL